MSISLIGHDRQINYLNVCRMRGTFPHAYLFHGPQHVGKLTIALALAQSFFCLSMDKSDIRSVCGACGSCRAIAAFRHPSIFFLDTSHTLVSKKEMRKEIPIEDIRELKRILSFAPQGNTMRLAIINEADKMSEEASNAFLKLLEEPGTYTLLILISPHKDLLAPTIISRVQSVGFLTVSRDIMEKVLTASDTATDDVDDILALAGGRPGVLVQLSKNLASVSDEKKLLHTIQNAVHDRDMVAALRVSEQISQDKELREKAVFWIMDNLRNQLASIPSYIACEAIVKKIKRIDRITELVESTNVNPRLAMDVMFLECMA